jgi:hypothetical protein
MNAINSTEYSTSQVSPTEAIILCLGSLRELRERTDGTIAPYPVTDFLTEYGKGQPIPEGLRTGFRLFDIGSPEWSRVAQMSGGDHPDIVGVDAVWPGGAQTLYLSITRNEGGLDMARIARQRDGGVIEPVAPRLLWVDEIQAMQRDVESITGALGPVDASAQQP